MRVGIGAMVDGWFTAQHMHGALQDRMGESWRNSVGVDSGGAEQRTTVVLTAKARQGKT